MTRATSPFTPPAPPANSNSPIPLNLAALRSAADDIRDIRAMASHIVLGADIAGLALDDLARVAIMAREIIRVLEIAGGAS